MSGESSVPKSIFDVIDSGKDINLAFENLEESFEKEGNCGIVAGHYESFESYINKNIFQSWKYKGYFKTVHQLKEACNIDTRRINLSYASEIQRLMYIEYVRNMMAIFDIYVSKEEYKSKTELYITLFSYYKDKRDGIFTIIDSILSCLNKKIWKIDEQKYIVTDIDPALAELEEILTDENHRKLLLEYKHVAIKNNIFEKEKILRTLAHYHEGRKAAFEKNSEFKQISKDLGFLFNEVNIRHNNVDGETAKPAVSELSDEQRLWIDDLTYQTYLTFLLVDDYNVELREEISKAKIMVNQK